MSEVSNSDDVIDSRSIIERIEELEGDRDSYTDDTVPDYDDLEDGQTLRAVAWAKENPDDAAELKALLALQSEAEGYCEDWEHGATLIRDSYFETYAQEY